MDAYTAFKIVHMLGIVLFLGNIIVTGVWKVAADRTKNPQVIAFAQRLVTLTDWVFTVGGVILILIGGNGMAFVAGYGLTSTSWLVWGQALFAASGVIWLAILIPVQIWQARIARRFENGTEIPPLYWRLNRQWYIWGTLATVIPLANLYVMVAKP
ncbi:MAG: DUF2269 domain-containing protein [Rhodomicrobium sp.]